MAAYYTRNKYFLVFPIKTSDVLVYLLAPLYRTVVFWVVLLFKECTVFTMFHHKRSLCSVAWIGKWRTRIENSAHGALRGWYDQSFGISGACVSYLETRTTPTVFKPLSCSTSAMKYWIINVLGSCPRFARTKQSTLMTQGCVESSLNDPGLRILHAGIVFFFLTNSGLLLRLIGVSDIAGQVGTELRDYLRSIAFAWLEMRNYHWLISATLPTDQR